jgi:Na+-driven multidrug efflux pump
MDALWYLVLLAMAALMIVPTFYGLWRAGRTGEWGWFAGIIAGWVFGLGWVVGLCFLLGPDRRFRADVAARMEAM